MSNKKDAFELSALKLTGEENELKNYIKRRNEEKKELESMIQEDEKKVEAYYKGIAPGKKVTQNIIMMYKTIDEKEKEKNLEKIKKLEDEIRMVRNEYLKVKNKKEKLLDISKEKRKEREKALEEKEFKRTLEDAKIIKIKKREEEINEN
jgi:hypothetical protein